MYSSVPTPTVRRSATACTIVSRSPACSRPQASSRSIRSAYTGRSNAFFTRVGLVVQSTGFKRLIAS
ncbi:hypothetical protein D3C72_2208190 [compost metagenome]